jgi:hypothetical protein
MTMKKHLFVLFAVVLAGAVLFTAVASARTSAVPRNTAAPTITGTLSEGNTLTAGTGSWANAPTAFAYQWRRCDSNGNGCTDIAGATKKTYTLTSDDADHTARVVVTASNADGQATATSDNTQLISSKNGPVNTVKPTVSGTEKAGEQLTATTGTWTGGVSSYSYQWQRCDSSGNNCVDVAGATGNTYGVRSADAGNTIRVVVTAKNASGTTAASSNTTGLIASAGGTVTVNQTTPSPSLTRPTLSFLSLKTVGIRAYARFRACTNAGGNLTVVEHDVRFGVLSYGRRFTVRPPHCGTYSRSWIPAVRFRTQGMLRVTLRAVDRHGLSSRLVSRSVHIPSL